MKKCCIIPRPVFNPNGTLLSNIKLELFLCLCYTIDTSILKQNTLENMREYFAETLVFQSITNYLFAIDTLDAKTNHVDIIFTINFYHSHREYF